MRQVALLVHDFQTQKDQCDPTGNAAGKYSITLNGTVRVEAGEIAEQYRKVCMSSMLSHASKPEHLLFERHARRFICNTIRGTSSLLSAMILQL